jgi:hypothetical protein
VYAREIEGQAYSFGVSGKLVMNALVMYDRETDSLWSQILGAAIEGPLKGTQLEFIPAQHTTWADWKAQHPDSLALVKGYRGDRSPYAGYFRSSQAGVVGRTNWDDRLYVKEFVIGLAGEREAAAYPFSVLNAEPVVNDTLEDQAVLIVFNPDTGAGVAFSRAVDDQDLTFKPVAGDPAAMTDVETGSAWHKMSGTAVAGPLAGTQLEPVKSTAAFWFGWVDWYPQTRIYGQ